MGLVFFFGDNINIYPQFLLDKYTQYVHLKTEKVAYKLMEEIFFIYKGL